MQVHIIDLAFLIEKLYHLFKGLTKKDFGEKLVILDFLEV